MKHTILFLLLVALTGALVPSAAAQGTAFLYQGRLNDGGSPATGAYDLRFSLYDAVTNGNAISYPQTNLAVSVSGGGFTQMLDFGPVFTGTNYWLAIGVRTNADTNGFTVLWPRQPLLPVPYAVFANSASNLLGKLPTAQLSGTLSSTQLSGTYSASVSFTNIANAFSGTFTGNGAALTSLNATALASGTVADGRLSTNAALRNANQTFTGANVFTGVNTFTNWGNTFIGNFSGNGLVQWVPVSNTAAQAVRDTGYLLLSSSLTTVTLPQSADMQIGDIVRISGGGSGGWLAAPNAGQSILGNFASFRGSYLVSAGYAKDWRSVATSADGSRMFAGNVSDYIYISSDFGRTWSSTIGSSQAQRSAMACSADGSKVFAINNNNAIQMSSDGGITWTNIANSGPGLNWVAIACTADGSKFYAAVYGGAIYQWAGSGFSYYQQNPANWTALACSSDGAVVAAAAGNSIGTTGGGITVSGNCSALVVSANGAKIAAAYNGGIATSTNSGANWIVTAMPATNWICLSGSSDCTRLAGGVSNGLFYASANFGATWSALTRTNQFWSGVKMSADGSKIAAVTSTSGSFIGNIFYPGTSVQPNFSTTNPICGSQGSAVELQFIGNNQFMPVGMTGLLWAN